jgi:hypothetical protein
MILEDGPVVIEDGEAGPRLDVKVVRRSRVVIVVDNGGEEQGKDLQIREPVLNPCLGDKPVGGLQHVAGVEIVVVGVGVLGVAQLQVAQQHFQCCGRDLVLVQAAVLLQQMVAYKAEGQIKNI